MQINVFNAGWPGNGTTELLNRFEADVAFQQPDGVLLLAGLNDMLYPGHTVPPEQFRHNLETLVQRCRNIGAWCVLGTLPPLYMPFFLEQFPSDEWSAADPAAKIDTANGIIREVAGNFELELWDVRAVISARPVGESADSLVMNPANSGRRDGMHWTAAGADAVAAAAFNLICPRCRDGQRLVCFGDSLTYGVYLRGKGTADSTGQTYPGRLAVRLEAW